jgi:hypothetical protein
MKIKTLVFPCGSQVGIDINFALRYSVNIEVFGASSIEDHGTFVYQNYIGGLPNIIDPHFIDEFNKILKTYGIDFIIPTHDSVALFLIERQERLFSKVVGSNSETAKLCRDKSETYEYLSSEWFIPRIYKKITNIETYPVFLKPRDGQGGKGTFIAESEEELRFYISLNPTLLMCEYLPGEELTVDCFTDRHGVLRYLKPRSRDRVLAGISVHSESSAITNEIVDITNTLNHKIVFRGYWYFQLRKDYQNKLKLLEISTRFAGTSSFNVASDVNLPLLSLLDFAGVDIDIQPNEYEVVLDRSYINRYTLNIDYERIYVDLDDTLIIRGKSNPTLMMFLHQAKNKGKEIFLITKHEFDVNQTLQRVNINANIFTRIIHLKPIDKKSDHMFSDVASIFIDNSFAERKEVRDKLDIPSFDVNSTECLLDWRG